MDRFIRHYLNRIRVFLANVEPTELRKTSNKLTWREIISCSILFCINPLYANNSALFNLNSPVESKFKEDLATNIHWTPYALVLIVLCSTLILLSRYVKKTGVPSTQFKIIEKVILSNKTKIYIADYQGQRFLIADNQNALAMHAIQEAPDHDS